MTNQDRDRRSDGRPEQGRPRDRTGRPLPYGTTDRPLAEEHAPTTVEAALRLGARLWDQERFFEAHECLEHVWHASPEADRDLWQGVIQVAVAGVHVQRGNPAGAAALLERAAERLDGYPSEHRGIATTATAVACRDAAARVRSSGTTRGVAIPRFPSTASGVWFTPDPSALLPPADPTPVPDGPTTRSPAVRRPRRRDEG